MSVASVVMDSHPLNSLHTGTVQDGTDKLYPSQQNGQPHVTFTASVNTIDDNCYVDSGPTTPLLSAQYKDSLEDDGADASEELSSDSETGPPVFLKHDDGTSIGEETSLRIALQVFFPYLVAGFGMVGAGAVLEIVKNWKVFLDVPEMMILVPPLLGLKGNLEMTLASRLSTQANLGRMDSASEQWKMIYGNISLIQAQALLVGLLAALFAIVLGWVPEGKFSVTHGLLMAASSVLTAGIASFVLGVVMVGVVVLSRRFRINPDNVATPIAASLGDLTTISLLAALARGLFCLVDTSSCAADTSCRSYFWLPPLLLSLALMLVPVWWCLAHYNKYTNDVLYSGWTPVIGAMVISSLGGLVLDYTVVSYDEVAVFQPVINGVGGNLVAVQASRLSTALHRVSTPGILPDSAVHGCPSPVSTTSPKVLVQEQHVCSY